MEQGKHYYAFISHSTKDEKIALWLCNKLDNYHIPATVQKEYGAPKNLKPNFTFQTNLAGNKLRKALGNELDDSQYLIVVCSPDAAHSNYVNDEVQHFIDTGRTDRIIPFIIEGTPEDCFPPALLALKGEDELRGVNLKETEKHLGSKMAAVVNVIATMLGVRFDVLWDRHKRRMKRQRLLVGLGISALLITSICVAYYVKWIKTDKTIQHSVAVAKNAMELIDEGNSEAALKSLIETIDDLQEAGQECYPDIELAFRKACQNKTTRINGHLEYASSAVFSSHGDTILSASQDGTLCLWDANTFEQMRMFRYNPKSIGIEPDGVNYACFSPNNQFIVAASNDNTIKVFDVNTCAEIQTLKGHNEEVNHVTYSPNGKLIASCSNDKTIKVWDSNTFEEIATLSGHAGEVYSVEFSPDSKSIVSASSDYTLKLWDVEKCSLIKTLQGHREEIRMASFSPDGQSIISASGDGTIKTWDVRGNAPIYSLTSNGPFNSVEYSKDGRYILSTSLLMVEGWVTLWDAKTGSPLRNLKLKTNVGTIRASFSPDGNSVVVSLWDKTGDIVVWDLENEHVTKKSFVGHNDGVTSIYFSSDGERLISASIDSTVRIWDIETQAELKNWHLQHSLMSAVFNPNNERILTLGEKFNPTMLDVASGKEIPNESKTALDWSDAITPDGHFVLLSEGLMESDPPFETITLEPDGIFCGCISHDGELIATSSIRADGEVNLWNAKGEKIRTFKHNGDAVTGLAFSSNDRFLVSSIIGVSANEIIVWELSSSQITAVIEFPFESNSFLSGDYDALAINETLSTAFVGSVRFNPNNTQIAYSLNNVIEVIDFPSLQELIDQTRERFKYRPITSEEQQ